MKVMIILMMAADRHVLDPIKIAVTESISTRLDTKIDDMEMRKDVRDQMTDGVDMRLDNFEQREKENNMIISGLGDNMTKNDIVKKLNEHHGTTLKPKDIQHTLKLEHRAQARRIRVAFKDGFKKRQVVKTKTKLKGKSI